MVGAPDVADFAVSDERVEGVEGLLDRREAVPFVHLVQVDVVGAQAPQAGLASPDEVLAREPGVVRPGAHGETRLGGDQGIAPPALEDLAHDLLRAAVRIDVGRVDQVDPGLEGLVDQGTRLAGGHAPDGSAGSGVPEGHVPRASTETRSPLCPSCRYSTANPPSSFASAPRAGPQGSLSVPGLRVYRRLVRRQRSGAIEATCYRSRTPLP